MRKVMANWNVLFISCTSLVVNYCESSERYDSLIEFTKSSVANGGHCEIDILKITAGAKIGKQRSLGTAISPSSN